MADVEMLLPRSMRALFENQSQRLWFNKDVFLNPNFESDSYIADLRRFVVLDTLRNELKGHLASLKNELMELINRDYSNLVNLSTKLGDLEAAVLRMRAPLTLLRGKISSVTDSVGSSLSSDQNGLQRRSLASSSREILELLLDTSHVVSKNLLFIQNMDKRIQIIKVSLENSLWHCFEIGLQCHDKNIIYNCLYAYATIDNTHGAEETFRSTIVAKYVQQFIPGSPLKDIVGCSAALLEENYQQIENSVEHECNFLLDIAAPENSGVHVLVFLANSILKEVLSAI